MYVITAEKVSAENRWPSEEASGHEKQTYCLVKVHPPSLGQSVTLHIVPPVFGSLSVFLSLFCPLTPPSSPLLYSLQGLFLFSSLRSKQVGEALSVPSSCLHRGGPAGNVPRSLLQAFPKVLLLIFASCSTFVFVFINLLLCFALALSRMCKTCVFLYIQYVCLMLLCTQKYFLISSTTSLILFSIC